jgi:hypothetical protein
MHHGASAQCLFNEWFGLNVEWSEFRDYTQLHSYQYREWVGQNFVCDQHDRVCDRENHQYRRQDFICCT